jgi:hypothetical protein
MKTRPRQFCAGKQTGCRYGRSSYLPQEDELSAENENENENDDAIPIVETYRGIGIHEEQPPERIASVVKPEIDTVHAMSDLSALAKYAADITRSPEARLIAAAKVAAAWQMAAEERRNRPDVDLERVRASVAGLRSRRARSATQYCSIYCTPVGPGRPGPAKRERRLPEQWPTRQNEARR